MPSVTGAAVIGERPSLPSDARCLRRRGAGLNLKQSCRPMGTPTAAGDGGGGDAASAMQQTSSTSTMMLDSSCRTGSTLLIIEQ